MRGWYQEKFKAMPPSYQTLIAKVQTVAPPAVTYPEIEIDAWNGWAKINGNVVPMSKTCFAALLLLANGCPVKELHAKLLALHSVQGVADCDWLATFQEGERFNEHSLVDAVYKTMSELRKKLQNAGFVNADALVPKRGCPLIFPHSNIKWHHREKLADICGYLFSSITS